MAAYRRRKCRGQRAEQVLFWRAKTEKKPTVRQDACRMLLSETNYKAQERLETTREESKRGLDRTNRWTAAPIFVGGAKQQKNLNYPTTDTHTDNTFGRRATA